MGVGKEGDKIEWKLNPWRRDGDGMGKRKGVEGSRELGWDEGR